MNDKTVMVVVETATEELYLSDNGLTLQREYGLTPNGNPLDGRWVLRDISGKLLDFDKYRNDLAERCNLDLRRL